MWITFKNGKLIACSLQRCNFEVEASCNAQQCVGKRVILTSFDIEKTNVSVQTVMGVSANKRRLTFATSTSKGILNRSVKLVLNVYLIFCWEILLNNLCTCFFYFDWWYCWRWRGSFVVIFLNFLNITSFSKVIYYNNSGIYILSMLVLRFCSFINVKVWT